MTFDGVWGIGALVMAAVVLFLSIVLTFVIIALHFRHRLWFRSLIEDIDSVQASLQPVLAYIDSVPAFLAALCVDVTNASDAAGSLHTDLDSVNARLGVVVGTLCQDMGAVLDTLCADLNAIPALLNTHVERSSVVLCAELATAAHAHNSVVNGYESLTKWVSGMYNMVQGLDNRVDGSNTSES
ncbi:unnamed protein product [Cyclocybe aegerita]|uniref:Uncharacterized protein n=1 Tax=Cyclocybe aegerita TaxID=1973307 RepID=A0A8S0X9A8_CYCAE|nr:unnamed protein product [Cyclocybe aegerita]